MNLHEDVIYDLLPLYFSDEASAASRELVDAYFATHPAFANAARASQGTSAGAPSLPAASAGAAPLRRIQELLRMRSIVLGVAIALTVMPLSFIVENGHLTWLMMRDAPASASLFGICGAIAWVGWGVLNRRLRLG